jgi:DNA-binding XRE family transcriptional regulator
MKCKKKRKAAKMTPDIEAGHRIRKLRGSFTQAKFAQLLQVTQPMVAAWEAGRKLPSSADLWIRFGEFAGYPDCFWFWERAGLDRGKLLSATEKMLKDQIKDADLPFILDKIVLVPRVRKTLQGLEPAGLPLPMPAEMVLNPLSTYCLMLESGQAVVDTADSEAKNLTAFLGQAIVVDFAPKTKRKDYPRWPEGLRIGVLFLQEQGGVGMTGIEWTVEFLMLNRVETEPITIGSLIVQSALAQQRPKNPSPDDFERDRKDQMLRVVNEIQLAPGCKIFGKIVPQFGKIIELFA